MPELPEVETIKLGLQKKIIGLKIQKIQILSPKSFLGNPSFVEGESVEKVERFAKVLVISLGENSLLFHLKMTGQVIYDSGQRFIGGHPTPDMKDQMPNSHTRVIISFSDGSRLYFNDQRKFGWVKLVETDKIQEQPFSQKLGPEPLEKEFSWQILKEKLLRHKSMPIKVAVMDQQTVSGVGNIYASEACFLAGIDPKIKAKDLTDQQFKRLHKGIIKSLEDGIKYGGASRAHFVDSDGHKGYFLDYAFVYGRNKHKCKKCGTEIKKITLGGRGTYLCPKCQT